MISSYKYYYSCLISRLILHKHYLPYCPDVSSIYIEVSSNTLVNTDDISVLRSLKALELVSGQKPFVLSSGSRYVGTSKRSFFSATVNLKKKNIPSFLEFLTTCFIPNFQKRIGVLSDLALGKHTRFTVTCKDIQLFTEYEGPLLPYNVLVTLSPSFVGTSFFDLLQLYKFNFLR